MNIAVMIPLIIAVGLISSLIASLMGLGGGIVAIALSLFIIGGGNSVPAKAMSYTSIVALAMVAIYKYTKHGKKPDWSAAMWILIGALPTSIIAEIYIGPLLMTEEMKPYFHLMYAVIIVGVTTLIIFKEKIKVKGINNYHLPFFGGIIGVMSGTFGLSGGILYVPLLVIVLGFSLKQAAVTSLAIKLPVAVINLVALGASGQFDTFGDAGLVWYLPLIIVIGSIAGAIIGPKISKKVNEKTMKIIFVSVMVSLFILEVSHWLLLLFNVL